MDDRRKTITIRLTVRLCVVSGQMQDSWRSSREFVAKWIRCRIMRVVLFCLTHLLSDD